MPRLFTTREGAAGVALETLGGTISGAVGIYIANRLWQPLGQWLGKWLGNWSGAVGNIIIAMIVNYIADRMGEGMFESFLRGAAVGMAGWGLAHALGWNPGRTVTVRAYVSPWSTLEPIPLRP